MKSTFRKTETPSHVAIIMDGNGRWASSRGWPRVAGHRAGADAVRRTVEAAPSQDIRTLTLYAFSSDNWRRPPAEVSTLMGLFEDYLASETQQCVEKGIRISVIGRRDRLSLRLCGAIEAAENATASSTALHVRVAVDYSSRDTILDAVTKLRTEPAVTRGAFSRILAGTDNDATEVDLLIRTGGEKRLSDFLLWECAYAELFFTPVMWPDFAAADLEEAVAEYAGRERRFGALPAASIAS